jgi:hypothetical protein
MLRRSKGLLLALGLLAACVAWNLGAFDRKAEIIRRYQPRFVSLPRPEVVRLGSLGFHSLAADLYWIGALNYFGDDRNERIAFAQLSNYLELVVALDPDFEIAYQYGGVALPWNTGKEWIHIDQAISLLERGVQRFPNEWKLRFELAYTYVAYTSRYRDAGQQLAAAALLPGAPPYLASLATRMYGSAGDYDGAARIAEQMMAETKDEELRAGMAQRLREIDVVRNITRLEALVAQFRADHQRLPTTLDELVSAGLIAQIPPEALGGRFQYDPATGTVESSVLHERLKLFTHP